MSLTWARGVQADIGSAVIRGGPFPDDIEAAITRVYGPHPAYASGYHRGLDLVPWARVQDGAYEWWPYPAGEGCPLLALGYGTVYWAGYEPSGFGNYVGIEYEDGEGGAYQVQYFHMVVPAAVAIGEHVAPGQVVGFVGTTGFSTDPHLHIAVYHNYYIQDPFPFLDQCPPLGYVPPPPATEPPAGVQYDYTPPEVNLEYLGPGDVEWHHRYKIRIKTPLVNDYIDMPRLGHEGDEEIVGLTIQHWREY